MALPLEGIRVVDWTIWQQGPVASLMLGDFGAEVIKIEAREGDPGRGILRAQGLDLTDRPNFYFEANNRNKKSLAIDLKKPEGVEIVRRLTDRADVFVQNFRKGVAARLGLDAATLRARGGALRSIRSGTTPAAATGGGSRSACCSPTATGRSSARRSRFPRRRPIRASRRCSSA